MRNAISYSLHPSQLELLWLTSKGIVTDEHILCRPSKLGVFSLKTLFICFFLSLDGPGFILLDTFNLWKPRSECHSSLWDVQFRMLTHVDLCRLKVPRCFYFLENYALAVSYPFSLLKYVKYVLIFADKTVDSERLERKSLHWVIEKIFFWLT